jgi:predicted nucleic acid-binding protein
MEISMPQPQEKGNNMQKTVMLLLMILFVSVVQVNAQSTPANSPSTPDTELIKQTALDYIEGWYEGNAERMERALHPDLAKRIVQSDTRGRSNLGQMGAMRLVQLTRIHDAKDIPKERHQKDVTVLDIFGNAASAKVIASDWVDYMHLAKWNGRWVIVNVLWELKPKK